MALKEQIVKIANYTGLYFRDDKNILNSKEVTTQELQKKVKPPYTLVMKFYQGKNLKMEQFHILDMSNTVKRNCDELQATRNTRQIQKDFTKKIIKAITLDEFFAEYQELKKTTQSQKTHFCNGLFYHKWVSPELGKRAIKDITAKDLQKIVRKILDDGKAPRTADTLKDLLRPVFKLAVKQKLCTDNPALDIEIPKFDNQIYFSLDDAKAENLYRAISNYHEPKIRAIFTFLANGRRRSETLQMRWEYIDYQAKEYKTPHTITKSGKTITYPLTDDIFEALKKVGLQKSGFIFSHDGGQTHIKGVEFHWKNIIQTAGIEKMRLHDLRHLIGYRATKAGVPLQAISKVLGHSSIQATQRYANTDTATIASVLELVKPKQ